MSVETKNCPECQTALSPVSINDLMGDRKVQGVETVFPAALAVFDHFDFWVCSHCGRTVLYASQEARKIAAEKRNRRR